jgi:proteasome lid subunit RPN8/RPN11
MPGKCVMTITDRYTEQHCEDSTLAEADVRSILAEVDSVTALFGRQAEACGYFMKCEAEEDGVHTFNLENVNAMEAGRFALHDDDCLLLAELIEQQMLLGLWHSHPNGQRRPSAEDWSGHPHGVPMYIVSVEGEDTYLIMRFTDEDRPGYIDPEGDSPWDD